jgi:hypothetical protein
VLTAVSDAVGYWRLLVSVPDAAAAAAW